MVTITPYLNFEGKTEEAFNFYKSVFRGEFIVFQRFRDIPGGNKMKEADQEKIMHVSLLVGKNAVIAGTDALKSMGQSLTVGDNIHLSVSPENEAHADELFNRLSVGGQITMPMSKAFWGAYFGMVKDRFGVQWMVNFDKNRQDTQ